MKWNSDPRLWCAIRILVGIIFAYGGLSKLLEPSANFEASLMKYGVFPPRWIPWIAGIAPWLEWVLGSFFILGYLPRFAGTGLVLLSFSFLMTLGSSRIFLISGDTDCGCFGVGGLPLSLHQVFLLDLMSFAASLRLVFLNDFPFSLQSFILKKSRK